MCSSDLLESFFREYGLLDTSGFLIVLFEIYIGILCNLGSCLSLAISCGSSCGQRGKGC